jgi:hypothetical protein
LSEDKVTCHTSTPGKQPTRIDVWKYDCVRAAILAVVPADGAGVAFKDLLGLVLAQLSAAHRLDLGSVSWYTVSVKLHMETLGELVRVEVAKPQRLLRTLFERP